MARSDALAQEIRVMVGIERAMGKINDLPEGARVRVAAWVVDVYLAPSAALGRSGSQDGAQAGKAVQG